MYKYKLLPFDVGMIYVLDVNKCIHLVSGGTLSNSLGLFYGALLCRLLKLALYKGILFL